MNWEKYFSFLVCPWCDFLSSSCWSFFLTQFGEKDFHSGDGRKGMKSQEMVGGWEKQWDGSKSILF